MVVINATTSTSHANKWSKFVGCHRDWAILICLALRRKKKSNDYYVYDTLANCCFGLKVEGLRVWDMRAAMLPKQIHFLLLRKREKKKKKQPWKHVRT